jgi:hypothetical protein
MRGWANLSSGKSSKPTRPSTPEEIKAFAALANSVK